jgi:hypothetical protein
MTTNTLLLLLLYFYLMLLKQWKSATKKFQWNVQRTLVSEENVCFFQDSGAIKVLNIQN